MGLATEPFGHPHSLQLDHIMRVERVAFAEKVRAARAVLDLSQNQFAHQVGLTQKSVHGIEQADVQPKARTILMIENFWSSQGISFESSRDEGFRLIVESSALLRD